MIAALNALLAALALAAIACRLVQLDPLRGRWAYHVWVTAHVLLGAACFGQVCVFLVGQPPVYTHTLLYLGLLFLLLGRGERRKGEARA
jgi:hypothetical protein